MADSADEGLRALNEAALDDARGMLGACCGATRWVDAMLAARPFSSRAAMHEAARASWRGIDRAGVLEAMSHHPRIGDLKSEASREATREMREGCQRAQADLKSYKQEHDC